MSRKPTPKYEPVTYRKARVPKLYKRGDNFYLRVRKADGKETFQRLAVAGVEDAYRAAMEFESRPAFRQVADPNVTLATMRDDYRARFVGKASYLNRLEGSWRTHLAPLMPLRMHEVTWHVIEQEVIQRMRRAGLAERTILATLNAVAVLYEHAKDEPWNLTLANPVRALPDKRRPKPKDKPRRVLTDAEMTRMIEAVSTWGEKYGKSAKNGHLYALIFVLGMTLGLRFSEALGIRRRDVDFDAMRLYVRGQIDFQGKTWVPDTKSDAGEREFVVSEYLKGYIQAAMLATHSSLTEPSDPIVLSRNRTPLKRSNIGPRMRNIMRIAGLDKPEVKGQPERVPTFHELRHSFASWCLEHMEELGGEAAVAAMLGHADFDVTRRVYSHEIRPERNRGTHASMIDARFGSR